MLFTYSVDSGDPHFARNKINKLNISGRFWVNKSEPESLNVRLNRFQGINSASLCSLAGRYDNPFPTRFLAPLDCLKVPTLN